MDEFLKRSNRQAKAGIYSYLLSFATSALGIYLWFELRDLISSLLIVFNINPSAWRAIDNFSFLLLGILWLACVFFVQHVYHKSYLAGCLFRRVCLVIGIQMLIWSVIRLISVLVRSVIMDALGWTILICIGGVGISLIYYTRNKRTAMNAEEIKG
ncbi:hypothetical protein ACFOLF_13910 [Paenibacillus sepulcri]|uniref:DUF2569 domain-containing protein n=1 Tax=Paenibacillus sepulcri TaxID=359917 RepID=A0ABS7BXH5_9BACL|nr:hypothetical protein [Paenibacillus sepulcri]